MKQTFEHICKVGTEVIATLKKSVWPKTDMLYSNSMIQFIPLSNSNRFLKRLGSFCLEGDFAEEVEAAVTHNEYSSFR